MGSADLDDETLCMKDSDGDGYGDSSVVGGVTSGSDCDDDNVLISLLVQMKSVMK